MKRKYVYVDTENIPLNNYISVFESLSEYDTLILMYTNKTPKISYKNVKTFTKARCTVISEYVENGRANALDFVLVSVLGQYVYRAPKSTHIILSADKGYDTVIKFYKNKGCDVQRYSFAKDIPK